MCMSAKNCLRKLAEHKYPARWQADFKMHNSPVLQLTCLLRKGILQYKYLGKACRDWYNCLSTMEQKDLQDLVVTLQSMIPPNEQHWSMLQANTTQGCINPASLDPELMECRCYD